MLDGQNSNSCVDSCTGGFKSTYNIDLTSGKFEQNDTHLVEILEGHIKNSNESEENGECTKNSKFIIKLFFIKF